MQRLPYARFDCQRECPPAPRPPQPFIAPKIREESLPNADRQWPEGPEDRHLFMEVVIRLFKPTDLTFQVPIRLCKLTDFIFQAADLQFEPL